MRNKPMIPSCTSVGNVRITEVTRPPVFHWARETQWVPNLPCSFKENTLKFEVPWTKGTEQPICGCVRQASHHIKTQTGSYRSHGLDKSHLGLNLRSLRTIALPRKRMRHYKGCKHHLWCIHHAPESCTSGIAPSGRLVHACKPDTYM